MTISTYSTADTSAEALTFGLCVLAVGALSFTVVQPRPFKDETCEAFGRRLQLQSSDSVGMSFAFRDHTGGWGLLSFMNQKGGYMAKCYVEGCVGMPCDHVLQIQIAAKRQPKETGLATSVHELIVRSLAQLGYVGAPSLDEAMQSSSCSHKAAIATQDVRVARLLRQERQHHQALLGACHRFVRYAGADDFGVDDLNVFRSCHVKELVEHCAAIRALSAGSFSSYYYATQVHGSRHSDADASHAALRASFQHTDCGNAGNDCMTSSVPRHEETQYACDTLGRAVPFVASWATPLSDLPMRFAAALSLANDIDVASHSRLHSKLLRKAFASWDTSQQVEVSLPRLTTMQLEAILHKFGWLLRCLHKTLELIADASGEGEDESMDPEGTRFLCSLGLAEGDGSLTPDLADELRDAGRPSFQRWIFKPPRILRMLSAVYIRSVLKPLGVDVMQRLHTISLLAQEFEFLCEDDNGVHDANQEVDGGSGDGGDTREDAGLPDDDGCKTRLLPPLFRMVPASGMWSFQAQLALAHLSACLTGSETFPCRSLSKDSPNTADALLQQRRPWRQVCGLQASSAGSDAGHGADSNSTGMLREVATIRALHFARMHSSWPPPLLEARLGGVASKLWPVAGNLLLYVREEPADKGEESCASVPDRPGCLQSCPHAFPPLCANCPPHHPAPPPPLLRANPCRPVHMSIHTPSSRCPHPVHALITSSSNCQVTSYCSCPTTRCSPCCSCAWVSLRCYA